MRTVVQSSEHADDPPPPRKTRSLRDREIASEVVRVESTGIGADVAHPCTSLPCSAFLVSVASGVGDSSISKKKPWLCFGLFALGLAFALAMRSFSFLISEGVSAGFFGFAFFSAFGFAYRVEALAEAASQSTGTSSNQCIAIAYTTAGSMCPLEP